MPLLVRGPVVKPPPVGQPRLRTDKPTLNTNFFPTLTDLAAVTTPGYVDGRSLRPVLEGSATTWRTAILIELDKTIFGIRTSDGRKYIEYGNGVKEYYDLNADPYELRNLVYYEAVPPTELRTRLQALKGCAGDTCRTAEGGGP